MKNCVNYDLQICGAYEEVIAAGANMDENIITWNFENWISVTLMVAVGLGAVSLLASLYRARKTKHA